MSVFCKRFLAGALACALLGCLGLPRAAWAYHSGATVQLIQYDGFFETRYSYSSLFRQNRDSFHWLDVGYSTSNYRVDRKSGKAKSISTIYRFSQRQRWHRNFKPRISFSVGAHRRDIQDSDSTTSRTETDLSASLGTGLVWEVGSIVTGFDLIGGYDWGFDQSFISLSLIFSYEI